MRLGSIQEVAHIWVSPPNTSINEHYTILIEVFATPTGATAIDNPFDLPNNAYKTTSSPALRVELLESLATMKNKVSAAPKD